MHSYIPAMPENTAGNCFAKARCFCHIRLNMIK